MTSFDASSHREDIPSPQDGLNHIPLSPVSFLRRSAQLYPEKIAVIEDNDQCSYAKLWQKVQHHAAALQAHGLQKGDVVSFLAPNISALIEAHFAVPLAGCLLNAINIRLEAASITFILQHAESKILFVDEDLFAVAQAALATMAPETRPLLVFVPAEGRETVSPDARAGYDKDYATFLAEGAAALATTNFPAIDENDPLALNYTSGTTGNPKGVLYSHRGAYLNAVANVMSFGLNRDSRYLWTLPMFHCNGWTHIWAVTLAAGTHVCLRRIDPERIFALLTEETITHFSAAPIVLTMLIHAPEAVKRIPKQRVEVATGGAAPPSAVIAAMEDLNCTVTHLYGLTESFGPCTKCEWQEAWGALPLAERALQMARQGLPHALLEELTVMDLTHQTPVPKDGKTLGELMIRSNTLMLGYYKNPTATEQAFAGGWFHSGDLAVWHPDGYIEIKDRSKDIIISGGENVSTLEVEEVLYSHESVVEAAVVARPDPKWGESPCAFVTLKDKSSLSEDELMAWCDERLAGFKRPRTIIFGDLPKTATGKIQKFVLRKRAHET